MHQPTMAGRATLLHGPNLRRTGKKLSGPLMLVLFYLAGVTIFGKGPTYIGIEPFFWGELVLVVSLGWAIRRWDRVVFRTFETKALTVLICAFMTQGAIEAFRDYGDWGLDALRDSAIWYYASFYFVGLVIASNRGEAESFSLRAKYCWLLAVPWGIADFLSGRGLETFGPALGSRAVSVFSSSENELIQSLGLGCLLLLMDRKLVKPLGSLPRMSIAALGLIVAAAAHSRGGRLAVLAALLVFIALGSSAKAANKFFRTRILIVLGLIVVVLVAVAASGNDILSSLQLDRFEGASLDNPDETAGWRTEWWKGIYAEVMERSPAFGLGFGDNLNGYSPYMQDQPDVLPTRAPHNYNVTVLARMGIVGTIIWAGILLFGLLIPFGKAIAASTPAEREIASHRSFWFAMLFATWTNSSLGVLMEGPVLGIPFWLILGFISARVPDQSRFLSRDFGFRAVSHAAIGVPLQKEPTVLPEAGS